MSSRFTEAGIDDANEDFDPAAVIAGLIELAAPEIQADGTLSVCACCGAPADGPTGIGSYGAAVFAMCRRCDDQGAPLPAATTRGDLRRWIHIPHDRRRQIRLLIAVAMAVDDARAERERQKEKGAFPRESAIQKTLDEMDYDLFGED